jgi:hypothetical protein
MPNKPLTTLLALALSVSIADAAEAASKRHKRVAKPAPAAAQQPSFHQEPARMYELRPGLWISTWGCYTDEGYGRYGSCDMREGHR